MNGFDGMGRLLLLIGVAIFLLGLLLLLLGRVPFLGRLPGDIVIRRDNFTCMVPIVSSILLSVILTILLNILLRLFRR